MYDSHAGESELCFPSVVTGMRLLAGGLIVCCYDVYIGSTTVMPLNKDTLMTVAFDCGFYGYLVYLMQL